MVFLLRRKKLHKRIMTDSKPIYLDYMATTPMDDRILPKMQSCMGQQSAFGNPASMHFYGQQAKALVEEAREQVAQLIGASSAEIVWTSGATEANNLSIKGAALFYQRQGRHIITLATEHKAVLMPCRYLTELGFEVTELMPRADGLLELEDLKKAIRKDTLLVSIAHVNSEIGVVQNIAAIGDLTRANGVLLHVDAAQSAGKIPIDVKRWNVDLLSLTAHKFYGPKGVGALYVRGTPQLHLTAQIHGGDQEHSLRAGTLAVPQIVGMGEASKLALAEMATEQTRLLKLREHFWSVISTLPNVSINGSMEKRIAGNLNVCFGDIDGEILISALSTEIAVSAASACGSLAFEPSHVLLALALDRKQAANSIRFSFGRFTTLEEIEFAAMRVKEVVGKLS